MNSRKLSSITEWKIQVLCDFISQFWRFFLTVVSISQFFPEVWDSDGSLKNEHFGLIFWRMLVTKQLMVAIDFHMFSLLWKSMATLNLTS